MRFICQERYLYFILTPRSLLGKKKKKNSRCTFFLPQILEFGMEKDLNVDNIYSFKYASERFLLQNNYSNSPCHL